MFRDRKDAGEQLAVLLRLRQYGGRQESILLALPRGGVPVAGVLARALTLPMDVLCVRKIGAPREPELAVGAVTEDGLVVLDQETIAAMQISKAALASIIERERAEVVRRERQYREYLEYRGPRPPLVLAGKTVLLVDDGLATGYSMQAAIRSVRRRGATSVVVAVPVAPRGALDRMLSAADEVFCIDRPLDFVAVGQYYNDFSQVTEEQVREELSGGV